ncbi:MAG TPA: GAF domain-containing protein [Oscillatoriaceae cyanobacterium M33_DOE_052]|uniref:GAF domain-containing protein n=1 Tax=Planktothricoides sp. SpSt-374 TaxID=2282167 RepID=A0A7C3ZG59_9CYAN|nr:GAF domain-containing protein [Oscillatoriaceae cyanobacterium M33_DOE_052]
MANDKLRMINQRLFGRMKRDVLLQQTISDIQESLDTDRVVLYYFYRQWEGQVICEAVKYADLSILGSTGADDCFNGEYAALYLGGRARAIADIETENINDCHRDFLRSIKVRSNLVVPVITHGSLWGLLVAHECYAPRTWTEADIKFLQQEAENVAASPAIVQV